MESLPDATRRILVIDDNPAIHEDIRKILAPEPQTGADLAQSEAALFGEPAADSGAAAPANPAFHVEGAYQGQDGVTLARRARDDGRPYALAFVDSRMPPGWDGVETIERLWSADPDVLVVFCTAYSDYTWQQIRRRLAHPERLVILKKPFDNIEVLQLADSLTEQWHRNRKERARFEDLEKLIHERGRDIAASQNIDSQLAEPDVIATQASQAGGAPLARRAAMERALRRAVDHGELSLRYQPLVEIASRSIVGLEALLRWENPELGRVSPAEFIPLAEETGLMEPIGEFVLRQACAQIMRWQKVDVPIVPIAVNVSAVQLESPSLCKTVRRILRDEGVQPQQIALELTESVLMKDVARQFAGLQHLRAEGVCIEIDDFGTGYSSLSRLKHLPIDVIKIDRSFITNLDTSSTDQAIVGAILAMARSVDLRVVAEGVETPAQLEILARHACDVAQGYHFCAPLPASECEQLLIDLATRTSFSDTLRLKPRGSDTFLQSAAFTPSSQ